MSLDKDKKIEIQQKLIEQLTDENTQLKEKLLRAQSKLENNDVELESSIKEFQKSKKKYDELIDELEKLKMDYHIRYDIYRKLTDK